MSIEIIQEPSASIGLGDTGPKEELYNFAVLYENEIDKDVVDNIIVDVKRIAGECVLKATLVNKHYLFQLGKDDVEMMTVVIQTILDLGYCLYINDGSDVIFRPGMTFNRVTHQRLQLMNYRCFLKQNDVRLLKGNVRTLFLNRAYWLIEDGQQFAEMMKSSFSRGMKQGKPCVIVNENLVRKWVDARWTSAEYDSLHLSLKDYRRELAKPEGVAGRNHSELRRMIRQTENRLRGLKDSNKKILRRIKKMDKEEDAKLKSN